MCITISYLEKFTPKTNKMTLAVWANLSLVLTFLAALRRSGFGPLTLATSCQDVAFSFQSIINTRSYRYIHIFGCICVKKREVPTFSASKWSQGQYIKILSLYSLHIYVHIYHIWEKVGVIETPMALYFVVKLKIGSHNLLFSILQLCVLEVLLTLLVNFQGKYYNFYCRHHSNN